jgi:hypothetical protein
MNYFLSVLACIICYLLFNLYTLNNKLAKFKETEIVQKEVHKQNVEKVKVFSIKQVKLFKEGKKDEVSDTIGKHTISL